MGVLFSSQFKSSADEEYKVDLFYEGYTLISWDVIGGSGQKYYIKGDWTDYIQLNDSVKVWDDDFPTSSSKTVFEAIYNESENRTEIRFTIGGYDPTIDRIEHQDTAPIFDPNIIDIYTEWENDGDILLAPIKASNTMITYANNDSFFDWFLDKYVAATDQTFKLVIYKDNTGWELEWAGNIVIDLLEWDNIPKPRPVTFKAIDGFDLLKDIPYSDVTVSPDDEKLKEHIYRIFAKTELAQFWDTLDPYLRESIEYKSNEVTGTLTASHSPLDYVFMHDRMFFEKGDNEEVEGISCYDALKAILELFSCRIFISQGCYYIQQVRNYESGSIFYREYTKAMSSYTASSYTFELTSGGNDRAEDLVTMAGGKFAYLAGLYKVSMPTRRHDQLLTRISTGSINVGTGVNRDGNPYIGEEFSMGTIDGGVGSGAYLTVGNDVHTNSMISSDHLVLSYLMYQGGTVGLHRPIKTSSSGSDIYVSKEGFDNWDLLGRLSGSTTVTIYNGAGAAIAVGLAISNTSNQGNSTVKITLSSGTYTSSWAYIKTNDYTDTYFLSGGNGNPLQWVTMDYTQCYYQKLFKPPFSNSHTLKTPEVPFDGEVLFHLRADANDWKGIALSKAFTSFAEIFKTYFIAPVGNTLEYNEDIEIENISSGYTKELELDPLNISEQNTATSLNHLRVAEDYLTTNTPTYAASESWDADFDADYDLNITRIMEAMSLQYRPIERYMGTFEGQYYPHYAIGFNDKTYFLNACRKKYSMDETEGEWIEQTNRRAGLIPTEYKGWEDSEEETTGDGNTSGMVGMFNNNHKITTLDADSGAGTTTSLTIEANEIKLLSGESIVVVDPTSNDVVEEFVLSADLAAGATTASVTSQVTTKDIVEGMAIQPKKDVIWDRTVDLDSRVTTVETDLDAAELDITELQFDLDTKSADFTLALTDAWKFILADSTSTIDITIDTNANVAFPANTQIKICRYDTGAVTFTAESGVTIKGLTAISATDEVVTLKKLGTDLWLIYA